MPDIRTHQNDPDLLALRAAIFNTFSGPKRSYTMIFYLTLFLAALTIVNNLSVRNWDAYLSIAAVILLVVETTHRRQVEAQLSKGALLGDLYDFKLFGLPLPAAREQERPALTDIMVLAGHRDVSTFKDWYIGLAPFPLPLQPVVCQLTNATWDYLVRCRLSKATFWTAGIYALAMVLLAVRLNLSFQATGLKILLPAFPFLYLLLDLHIESRASLVNLHGVKNAIERSLRQGGGVASPDVIYAHQEHLYKHRATAFPVPNVLHALVKGGIAGEIEMCLQALARENTRTP